MNFFVCHPIEDETRRQDHDDRIQLLSFLSGHAEEAPRLEDADVYIALGGMYLTWGYREKLEQELQQASAQGLPIVVVRPFGTGYVPAALRPYADGVCSLNRASVQALIDQLQK